MTVIAANKNCMASDSQFTSGNLISYGTKLFRIRNDIIGFTGYSEDGYIFADWYKNNTAKPVLDDCFVALILTKGKLYYCSNKCFNVPVKEQFTAIGCGTYVAIGAMAAGKTPIEAVKITCKYIDGCGLPAKEMIAYYNPENPTNRKLK